MRRWCSGGSEEGNSEQPVKRAGTHTCPLATHTSGQFIHNNSSHAIYLSMCACCPFLLLGPIKITSPSSSRQVKIERNRHFDIHNNSSSSHRQVCSDLKQCKTVSFIPHLRQYLCSCPRRYDKFNRNGAPSGSPMIRRIVRQIVA